MNKPRNPNPNLAATPGEREKQDYLVAVGSVLHKYGTPSHRLERVMTEISRRMGVQSGFLYTPTSLMVSFDAPDGERTRMIRIDAGDVDLGKLDQFDSALERLESNQVSLAKSLSEIKAIDSAPPIYSWWVSGLAWGVASSAATGFLSGGCLEMLVAFFIGILIFATRAVFKDTNGTGNLADTFSGFLAAFACLLFAAFIVPIDDRIATLGSLIVLVPGLSFTVAMTELATRHLVSGVARMAGASITLLTLVVGVALAWRLGHELRPANITEFPLPTWGYLLAVAVSPIAFAILLSAGIRQWLVISLVCWAGIGSSFFGGHFLGAEFGPFLGALVIGLLANIYARLADRPAMIPQVPSLLVLVPGSIGFQSLTSFINQDALAGVDSAFSMVIVAASLVGGTLAANGIISPRRIL